MSKEEVIRPETRSGAISGHGRLGGKTSIGLALAIVGLLAAYCWMKEGAGVTLVFTFGVTIAIMAAVALLTRRLFFAALLTAAMVVGVVALGWLKQSADDMILHGWDFVQFFSSTDDVAALWRDRPGVLVAGCAVIVVAAFLLRLAFRADPPLARRGWSALALIACAAVSVMAGEEKPERAHTQYFWFDMHLTSFYASMQDVVDAALRGGMVSAAARAPGAPLAKAGACAPGETSPHILLIHEESVTEPDLFPGLDFDRGLMPFFNSDDGKLHRLRVETYGGASWLTEFSVFAGVSSRAYGTMRNFVHIFTAGRIGEALPKVLAGCGYRNIMFTPWDKAFMAVARFYESIGFAEIDDRKAQGNVEENERDRFFFTNVLRRIETHVTASRQPMFLFVETMSAHWPYDYVYMPEVDVPGGGPGTPPMMSEYLRRLAMVKMDDDWLRAELARRFPGERFLIVRYGDHHPTATLPLLGKPAEISAEEAQFPDDSLAYITFYAVNGVGYSPPPPPAIETVDVGYLGAILLDAARLPAPPSWSERARLMKACDGRYWSCPDKDAILTFHRRLLDAGLVTAR